MVNSFINTIVVTKLTATIMGMKNPCTLTILVQIPTIAQTPIVHFPTTLAIQAIPTKSKSMATTKTETIMATIRITNLTATTHLPHMIHTHLIHHMVIILTSHLSHMAIMVITHLIHTMFTLTQILSMLRKLNTSTSPTLTPNRFHTLRKSRFQGQSTSTKHTMSQRRSQSRPTNR